LFNPILPYDLYAMKTEPDAMHGTAYRLVRLAKLLDSKGEKYLYKPFQAQPVGDSDGGLMG
jgi:hypothetical protein